MADYAQSGGNAGRTESTSERVDPTSWTLLWKHRCVGPFGTGVPETLMKKRDCLIVNHFPTNATDRTTIQSLDAVTGHLRWRHEVPGPGRCHIRALVGDLVLAVASDGPLIALSLDDGSEQWRRECPDFSDPIALDDDLIVLTPPADELSEHSTMSRTDGTMETDKWRVPCAQFTTALASAEGRLFTLEGEPRGETRLVARDAVSGRTLWTSASTGVLKRARGHDIAASGAYVTASMETSENWDDVGSLSFGLLACFDADTGSLRWAFRDPEPGSASAPAISENRVCVTTGYVTSMFRCFDLATGEILTRTPWPCESGRNELPASNGFIAPPVYFHVISGGILRGAVIESGAVCWEYRTDGVFARPFVSDGRLYAANLDGYVYCFGVA